MPERFACAQDECASSFKVWTANMDDVVLTSFANTFLIEDGYKGAVLKFEGPPHLRRKKPHKVRSAGVSRLIFCHVRWLFPLWRVCWLFSHSAGRHSVVNLF